MWFDFKEAIMSVIIWTILNIIMVGFFCFVLWELPDKTLTFIILRAYLYLMFFGAIFRGIFGMNK
jgi:hypothetical protein